MKKFIEIESGSEKVLLSISHIVSIHPNGDNASRIIMDIDKNTSNNRLTYIANESYENLVKRISEYVL